jgi:hypothetical protein
MAIKPQFSTLNGKFILQGQAAVIKDAVAGGISPEIEAHATYFFEPDPVKNAQAYFFRRIFHDRSDAVCLTILQSTAVSMGAHSKVLIAEYEVLTIAAPAKLTIHDINMMRLGSCERMNTTWANLLDSAGLTLTKTLWTAGSNSVVVAERVKQE